MPMSLSLNLIYISIRPTLIMRGPLNRGPLKISMGSVLLRPFGAPCVETGGGRGEQAMLKAATQRARPRSPGCVTAPLSPALPPPPRWADEWILEGGVDG